VISTILTAAAAVSPDTLLHLASEPPPVKTEINTAGIINWIVKYILPVMFGLAGVLIVGSFMSGKGQMKEVMTRAAGMTIGVVFIAAAFSFYTFGQTLTGVFLK
jgi:hypothetical protein